MEARLTLFKPMMAVNNNNCYFSLSVVSLKKRKDSIMNVSLTPHFDDFINEKIKSGQYHSASEVVRAALRLLEQQEELKQARIDILRQEIQKGIDSPTREWNMAGFLENAQKRAGINTKD